MIEVTGSFPKVLRKRPRDVNREVSFVPQPSSPPRATMRHEFAPHSLMQMRGTVSSKKRRYAEEIDPLSSINVLLTDIGVRILTLATAADRRHSAPDENPRNTLSPQVVW